MSKLDSLMDGSSAEHVVLGKIEHLLRGLYHVFQDVSSAILACLPVAEFFVN
jgi:hypothetical protein